MATELYHYQSPIGKLRIEIDGEAVTGLDIDNDEIDDTEGVYIQNPLIGKVIDELAEYFQGKRKDFDIPVKPSGTAFQLSVWKALQEIPYGETRTYGEVAAMIGNKKACRAVGGANHKNPIMILIPCHRVIGSDGSMVGFGAGITVKEKLLQIEREH
ncbi:MAG TPA: methylated-DNA--[protein]-cysteine S-methyltransferase [Lachnospiraceae bacterium]|nr:methylated-DNA--[protein]-cysteine S-methyltransferase [Lachnospiraceae bacterium]